MGRPAGWEGGGCVLLPVGRPGFLEASAAAAAAGLAAFLVVVLGMLCGGREDAGSRKCCCCGCPCYVLWEGKRREQRVVSARADACVARFGDMACMPEAWWAVGLGHDDRSRTQNAG